MKTIFLGLMILSAGAQASVKSPCAQYLSQYVAGQELKAKFFESKSGEQQLARTWVLQTSRPKSQADDRRARAISLEDSSQCLGILKGETDPTDSGIFPNGELSLDSFKMPDGKTFLLVHSDTFRQSFLRESHLIHYVGGNLNSALKKVWSAFTENASPSGEEEKFEMKTDSKNPKQLELNSKRWVWDSEKLEFQAQTP